MMSGSDFYSQGNRSEPAKETMMDKASQQAQSALSTMKDKASEAAGAVQEASADAYETVKQTAEEQPFIVGLLAGAAIGFALGAMWKLGSHRTATDRALDRLHSYADPHLRAIRNARWW